MGKEQSDMDIDLKDHIRDYIKEGRAILGIELGSTRIKAVLIGDDFKPVASGSRQWENTLKDGLWTYSLDDIWEGLRDCYLDLKKDVQNLYGIELTGLSAIGISAMMHGYMAFDKEGKLLVPFRTWRNTNTAKAADELTELFHFAIPQRWSIAHLYQAISDREEHVRDIDFITTLAGYIHWKLTGCKVIGTGDASGMFPIDDKTGQYDETMIGKFEDLILSQGVDLKLKEILPSILKAGERAGTLTEEGAKLLDPSGALKAGVPFCPPEGDAGTGMTATDSVAVHTGNVSAGTSVFSMVVLEKGLKEIHSQIDMVTTPEGRPVAMVHVNNCTSDLNDWAGLFKEFAACAGFEITDDDLYSLLYRKALEGDPDCNGLLSFGYLSGEPVTGFKEGRPLFVRTPDSDLNLANFMRTHLYSSLAALRIGMDILKEEGVTVDAMVGHGGFFKTPVVGQKIMAAALDTPISVMETAGEGGPWGMALLASYMLNKRKDEDLSSYLNDKVFADTRSVTIDPDPLDVSGFEVFMDRYKASLPIEKEAVRCL